MPSTDVRSQPLAFELDDGGERNPQWDGFVANSPGGHHVQASGWARVKATVGWGGARLIMRRQDEIVGGCQLLWRTLGGVVRVAYVPRGPLVTDDRPEAAGALLDELERTARRLRVAYLKVQPPVDRRELEELLARRGYQRSRLDVGPAASVRLDLSRPSEELLASMSQRIRRNIRQSEREGLTVRPGDRDDLPAFCEIIDATARRQGFENYPRAYWERFWDEFAPAGGLRLFVTELHGRVLSALLLIGFGDTVIFKMGGWTGERTKARPNESMHWAGIQWAQSAGYRYYDLEGIKLDVARALRAGTDPGEVEGVDAFKISMGGEITEYPGTYDAVLKPVRGRVARWGAGREFDHPLVQLILGRRSR